VVQELLGKGVVLNSQSQYASPAFLMPKPNGQYRLVIHYAFLNRKLVFDGFATPFGVFVLELHRARVFLVSDFSTAYCQIPLSADSLNITAYCTPFWILVVLNYLWVFVIVGKLVRSVLGEFAHHHVSTLRTVRWYTVRPLKNTLSF